MIKEFRFGTIRWYLNGMVRNVERHPFDQTGLAIWLTMSDFAGRISFFRSFFFSSKDKKKTSKKDGTSGKMSMRKVCCHRHQWARLRCNYFNLSFNDRCVRILTIRCLYDSIRRIYTANVMVHFSCALKISTVNTDSTKTLSINKLFRYR